MSNPTPGDVPNVVIRNPKTRERIYDAFGVVGLLLFAAVAADTVSPLFDIAAFTQPATAVYTILGAGIGYTARQNTPTF